MHELRESTTNILKTAISWAFMYTDQWFRWPLQALQAWEWERNWMTCRSGSGAEMKRVTPPITYIQNSLTPVGPATYTHAHVTSLSVIICACLQYCDHLELTHLWDICACLQYCDHIPHNAMPYMRASPPILKNGWTQLILWVAALKSAPPILQNGWTQRVLGLEVEVGLQIGVILRGGAPTPNKKGAP
jgi:hypothetical protein